LNSRQCEILASAMAFYSTEEITDAIVNYKWMRKNPDKVRIPLKFADMFNFLEKGLPSFFDMDTFDNNYLKGD
jgi:hypothetical protein